MNGICGDNRFQLIKEAKEMLCRDTNIEDSPEEMAVIDDILFRLWQMGWLPQQHSEEKKKLIEERATERVYEPAITGYDSLEQAYIRGAKEQLEIDKQAFIEKACEWMNERLPEYVVRVWDSNNQIPAVSNMGIEDFKKAMEE